MKTKAKSTFRGGNHQKALVFIGFDLQILQKALFLQLKTSFFMIWVVFFLSWKVSGWEPPTPWLASQAARQPARQPDSQPGSWTAWQSPSQAGSQAARQQANEQASESYLYQTANLPDLAFPS